MNFQQILDEHGVYYRTEGAYTRPGWVQFVCPHCSGGSDPNKLYCGYSLESGAVSCWRCSKHKALDTLVKLTGLSYRALAGVYKRPSLARIADHKPTGTLRLPARYGPLLACHKHYLRERGFDPKELVKLWGLKGVGIASELAYRIVIPIELYGETVSWTTRAIIDDIKDRYISASATQERVHHKNILYSEDYVRHAVIVVEGPSDVWRIGPGAVGTFGTGWSFAQLNRLLKFPVRYICFDQEPAAQKRAKQMYEALCMFPGKTKIIEIDASDPGSCSPKEVKRLRKLLE